MSFADQNAVIAVLRRDRLETAPDWTITALAAASGLKKQACRDAVQALRYQGKMEFAALALKPSMMIDVRPVTRVAAIGAGRAARRDAAPLAELAGELAVVERVAALPAAPAQGARAWLRGDDLARLQADVAAYLARTGMAPSTFSNRATGDNSFVTRLNAGRAGIATEAKVRAFMAEYPEGLAQRKARMPGSGFPVDAADARIIQAAVAARDDEAAAIAARADGVARSREIARQAALEAEAAGNNRRRAGQLSGTWNAVARFVPTPVEAVQSALAETPADAARALQRRWPDVWQAVLITARAQGATPMAMMIDAIETGLAAIEQFGSNQEEAA